MRKIFLSLALCLVALTSSAQISYTWHPVPMDSTWDSIKDTKATEIIAKYAPQVAPLQEIISYSDMEYTKRPPESELSNFAADVIKITAEKYSGEPVDIALTNFGGIRTSLPKGAVRVYDIYSIFPFDNYVLWFDIKGSDLRKFLNKMIGRNRIEALSGVEIVVRNHKPEKMNVAGAPLDDQKTYRMATINFLMDGGDGINLQNAAMNIGKTDAFIRDAIVDYLREQMAAGKTLQLKKDGRVQIYNEKEDK